MISFPPLRPLAISLRRRGEPLYASLADDLVGGSFALTSNAAAARWVFRASARQAKAASSSAEMPTADWGDGLDGAAAVPASDRWAPYLARQGFADVTQPLTIDLGCGFGCGPLAYAHSSQWQGDNVLGCDLSASGIGYARGLTSRWGIASRCRFVRDDARAVLQAAREYPGEVHRVILSCPTPYAALQSEGTAEYDAAQAAATEAAAATLLSGNKQIRAVSAADPRFLGHSSIFDAIHESLAPGGELFLASNVEDVALTLLEGAQRRGFEPLTVPTTHGSDDRGAVASTVPRRQQRWRQLGGDRADGECWRPLPCRRRI